MAGQLPHKYPPYEDESQMRIKYWAKSTLLSTGDQYFAFRRLLSQITKGRTEVLLSAEKRLGNCTIHQLNLMRASVVEADRAHNPEVAASNLTPRYQDKAKGSGNAPLQFFGSTTYKFYHRTTT